MSSPINVGEFRPIRLCNVLYKIVSRVIVNHLKYVLSCVISKSQCGCLSNRPINDNVLVVYEVFYAIKSKKKNNPLLSSLT